MKKNILLMIVTAIIFTGIGVFATIGYQADEIGYGTGTVKDAIDDLYTTASNYNCVSGSVVLTNDSTTIDGQVIENILEPTIFYVYRLNKKTINFYIKSLDSANYYQFSENQPQNSGTLTDFFYTKDNALYMHNLGSTNIGDTVYYVACK